MAARRVEVVPRAVEVDRVKVNGVPAVLLPIGLRLHQQHFLGEAIRRVGLFRIAIPQIVLDKWHWSEFRIGANGVDRHKLRYPRLPASVHQLRAHYQILKKNSAG